MRSKLLVLDAALLFLCVSIYLGTGWSLVLFQFPSASSLTVDTYYQYFVPPVQAATRFFTYMTGLMIALAIVMMIAEWRTGFRWVPIVVLLAVGAATLLTTWLIFPINAAMAKGITDPALLHPTLNRWMSLNRVRVSLWTVQWLAMMAYFAIKAYRAPRRAP